MKKDGGQHHGRGQRHPRPRICALSVGAFASPTKVPTKLSKMSSALVTSLCKRVTGLPSVTQNPPPRPAWGTAGRGQIPGTANTMGPDGRAGVHRGEALDPLGPSATHAGWTEGEGAFYQVYSDRV